MPDRIGATVAAAFLSNQVGIGSSWHCFVDDFFKTAATSTAVVGLRMDRGSVTGLSAITGADDADVDANGVNLV
jgi:hypothetical protein